MVLPAVETVTNADPVWQPRCHKSDVAAQATTRESIHVHLLPNQACRTFTTSRRAIAIAHRDTSFDALPSSAAGCAIECGAEANAKRKSLVRRLDP
jgi:hypothetical protein